MSSDLLPRNEDIVLASAFISDAQKRADVLVLHAFLEALRDIPVRVTEPLMGEIRLRWWFEAIEEIRDGRRVRYHPLTEALKGLICRYRLDPQLFLDMTEGQMPLLDGKVDLRAALDVVDSGDFAVQTCAAVIIRPQDGRAGGQCARLFGILGLRRAGFLPAEDFGETEFRHLLDDAGADLRQLDSDLLPLALPGILAAAEFRRGRPLGPLEKRLKLLGSYLTGRL